MNKRINYKNCKLFSGRVKQLPTHIAYIAKAPQAYAVTKALSKSAIFPLIIITFAQLNFTV